jgi:hypothetical protein
MKYIFLPFLAFLFITSISCGQDLSQKYSSLGKLIMYELEHSAFPEQLRDTGHVYKSVHYSKEKHYSNKSALIFIPKHFKETDSINFVYYFHGWVNNIQKAIVTFDIIEQFEKSGVNAILIAAETAYDAPDSYGGNLEKENFFNSQLNEIANKLKSDRHLTKTKIGKIVLAGHSGAFRVMAFMLEFGGLSNNVKEVYLFDALYSQTDKFINWIELSDNRFINIYCDDGGTKEKTEEMMKMLEVDNVKFYQVKEVNLSSDMLKDNRIIFIHSDLQHNEVIFKREQFYKFLSTGFLIEN